MRKESIKLENSYDAPKVEIVCLNMESGCLNQRSGDPEGYDVDDDPVNW